ncbi:MAG TPA: hypothetical protein VL625_07280 [Patescibacteria group bacterium]|nr:hypothetical protein [Patescibacteria group bacterium]
MNGPDGQNLSGFWTGVYDYPDTHEQPVPFNAVIRDEGGSISGEIIEPNTFAKCNDRELFAVLSGTRSGSDVHFVKSYEDLPEAGHCIAYRGTLNADGTKLEGQWSTMEPGYSYSGPFVMNRKSGKKAEQKVKEKAGREAARTGPEEKS